MMAAAMEGQLVETPAIAVRESEDRIRTARRHVD